MGLKQYNHREKDGSTDYQIPCPHCKHLIISVPSQTLHKSSYGWRGGGDGAAVSALASHQCGTGLIPRLSVICGLSLLLVLVLALQFNLKSVLN